MSGVPKDRLVTRAEETAASGNETGRMEIFEANKLYLAGDPALNVLGSPLDSRTLEEPGSGTGFHQARLARRLPRLGTEPVARRSHRSTDRRRPGPTGPPGARPKSGPNRRCIDRAVDR